MNEPEKQEKPVVPNYADALAQRKRMLREAQARRAQYLKQGSLSPGAMNKKTTRRPR